MEEEYNNIEKRIRRKNSKETIWILRAEEESKIKKKKQEEMFMVLTL